MHTTHTRNRFWLLMGLLLTLPVLGVWADSLYSSKKKEFSETFTAGANDQLLLDNRYGTITVVHWDKNEVAIRVEVESRANSDSKAQEGLDRVRIDLRKSGSSISGVTSLGSQSGWNNDNNRITINYYISMPSRLAVKISQKYGNINLPNKNEGKCQLEVKYGNLNAGSFTAPLVIDAGYSNITLTDFQDLRMDLSYCGNVSLGSGNNLRMDSKYSHVVARDIAKLIFEKKYGSLKMQKNEYLNMSVKYSQVDIEYVKEELNVGTLDYSTLNIKELASDFKKVDIMARYGNVNVGISSKATFRVAAERMKYGNVRMEGLNITNTNIENKTDHYYQVNGGGNRSILFNGNSYSNIKVRSL